MLVIVTSDPDMQIEWSWGVIVSPGSELPQMARIVLHTKRDEQDFGLDDGSPKSTWHIPCDAKQLKGKKGIRLLRALSELARGERHCLRDGPHPVAEGRPFQEILLSSNDNAD